MTIEYKDSKRIVGLSSESLLTSSDYTSSNFTTVGSTVAITNNSVVFTNSPTNADNRVYESITALAESDVWSIDFKVNQSSGGTFDCFFLFLSATDGVPYATGNNVIWIQTQGTGYMRWVITKRVSGTNTSSTASNNSYSYNTDYYGTLSSDGTNITLKIWTSSARSGSPSVTLTVAVSGIGTMNYIQHGTKDSGDSSTWSGTVSEVSLSKTVIKPTNVQDNSLFVEKDTSNRYWFSAPTPALFDENFANALAWTQTGSDITIASNQLTWIGDRQNTSNGLHHDMGANVVNTSAWTLEFDLILDNYSAGTASNTHQLGVMMTNVHSGVGSLGSNATRDFIGMSLHWRTDTASQQRKFYAKDDNGSTDTWADNSPHNTPDDSTSQGFPTAGTTYHIKIIRTNATAYKIEIWNSDESSLLDTLNGACSNTSDLRYILVQKYGDSADGNPSFDGKIDNMKFYNSAVTPATWKQFLSGIGVFPVSTSTTDNIDYIVIETLGNAVDFGDLTTNRANPLGASNTTRGIFSGGNDGSYSTTMDYITLSTTGNATTFGDNTQARGSGGDGVSSETRAVFAGGQYPRRDTIDYVTIATTGNATSFGSLTNSRGDCGGVDDDVRGVFAGGYYGGAVNTIDYITIATPSNATSFGSLPSAEYGVGNGMSNKTRGVFPSGYNGHTKAMSYVTISTTGNATTFGNMVFNGEYTAGASSSTRGILAGGTNRDAGGDTKIIQYITIATTGNATTFGDLTTARSASTGVSDF